MALPKGCKYKAGRKGELNRGNSELVFYIKDPIQTPQFCNHLQGPKCNSRAGPCLHFSSGASSVFRKFFAECGNDSPQDPSPTSVPKHGCSNADNTPHPCGALAEPLRSPCGVLAESSRSPLGPRRRPDSAKVAQICSFLPSKHTR